MSDAVDIMNEFTNFNPSKGEEPLPLPIPGHWFRKICALADRIVAAEARAEAAEAKADRYEDALQKIDNWAKAYPLDVFPEPDLKRVREVLEAAGITLDSVSASNMRHVISGVERIVSEALKGGEE